MFQICGNSSIEVFLNHRSHLVSIGSVMALVGRFFGIVTGMERNFTILKGLRPFPKRSCKKKAGPGVSIFVISAITDKGINSTKSDIKARKMSNHLLKYRAYIFFISLKTILKISWQ